MHYGTNKAGGREDAGTHTPYGSLAGVILRSPNQCGVSPIKNFRAGFGDNPTARNRVFDKTGGQELKLSVFR